MSKTANIFSGFVWAWGRFRSARAEMNLLAAIAPQGATQLLRTLKPLLAINSGEFRTEALKGRLKDRS